MRSKQLMIWSATQGIRKYEDSKKVDEQIRDPLNALNHIELSTFPAIFVMLDFHHYLNDNVIVRKLRRKGRFDEIFFVDLPQPDEREEIFNSHIRKRKRDPGNFDRKAFTGNSEGFSGAEIEQAIIFSLFDAFVAGHDLTTDDICKSLKETVPLSQTMREQIDGIREWAGMRARPASRKQMFTVSAAGRRIEI
ncbi:MAG: hypothetical protein WC335_03785 [Candidatus Omnitrophota bacterium]